MERKNVYICMLAALLSCSDSVKVSRTLDAMPAIFPDYNGVVIPPNMAPLNFALDDQDAGSRAVFSFGGQQFEVKGEKGSIVIPPSKWKNLLESAAGDSIQVTVQVKQGNEWVAYSPFTIRVAPEKVDSYLAYRLIDPGYELWNKMGIYQRDLESYTQIPIIENKMSGNNCVNCHSFCMQDPNKMLFHMRETFPGTILVDGDKIEKLNTKTKETISPLVYPSWHPSGKYVAFSVNTTKQAFHLNDRNRVEVYDEASDVVVYDVEKHEIVTASNIFSKDAFETFPTFSPDGHFLYFCSAVAVDSLPQNCRQVKYSLCRIAFDFQNERLGEVVDTLYNARMEGQSVSFPRLSPDGRFLAFTLHDFGNFSIWHKEADLYMLDLLTSRKYPLDVFNSEEAESYHSWSGNGRWMVFSSRRIDGLYTRLFIGYVDSEGVGHKPFLLPQKDPLTYYDALMFSYNIPELMRSAVTVDACRLAGCLRSGKKSN